MLGSLIQETKARSSHGFSLLELLIALVVFVIGVLGVASLLVSGIHLQTLSRKATEASAFAEAKVEELRVIDLTDLQRSVGGALDSNVASHYDEPAGTSFTRRWQVSPGPAGTQDLTVAVIETDSNVQLTQIRLLLKD